MVTHDYWDEYKECRRKTPGRFLIKYPGGYINQAFYWADTPQGVEWESRDVAWEWVLWGFRQAQS